MDDKTKSLTAPCRRVVLVSVSSTVLLRLLSRSARGRQVEISLNALHEDLTMSEPHACRRGFIIVLDIVKRHDAWSGPYYPDAVTKSTYPTITRVRDNKRRWSNIRLMPQDNIVTSILKMRLTILRSVDAEDLSKPCPVFRVNGRPPIDRFTAKKWSYPTLQPANQPHSDAAATQDRASALASKPSSGDLG